MPGPTIEIQGLKDVERLVSYLPESVFKDAKKVFTDATLSTHKRVQNRFTSGPLHVRTGAARSSFKPHVSGTTLANLKAGVYSGAVMGKPLSYVPIHEFGGTIKAKNAYKWLPGGPYLNIPLDANKTKRAGVTRKTSTDVFNEGGYVFKSKSQNWFVAASNGIPMFILKQSVKIKPQLGFFKIAEDETANIISGLSDLLPQSWRKL